MKFKKIPTQKVKIILSNINAKYDIRLFQVLNKDENIHKWQSLKNHG